MKPLARFALLLVAIASPAVAAPQDINPLGAFAEAAAPAARKPIRWEKRSSFGPGRIMHSAVWTYSEMIVWGGGSDHQFYNSGGIYDPVTDRWREITEDGAPSPRWGHAAVWTGTEMIIWGGRSSFSPANHHRDGAIYDPRTNQWRPITLHGAPSARSQMAAIWTGQEMIVWGGWADDGQCPATGAAYDPRADRWTDLPLDGAPEGRIDPAAVWTGKDMIVWGGLLQGENRTTATGARFDPDARKWIPLPLDGAPAPARGHTATWTGTEMIVWGGAKLDDARTNIGVNTGGRYSPERNAWTPTTVPDAFEGRLFHVAAWDGTDLILWGGGDQQKGCLNSGAAYDPQTGRWRAVPDDAAPSARSLTTAVWTGEGILIYGGSTGGSAAFADTYYLRLGPD